MKNASFIFAGPKGHQTAFIRLNEDEKMRMFAKYDTWEQRCEYWKKQLVLHEREATKIMSVIQLKDMAGNWMNIFMVNYK